MPEAVSCEKQNGPEFSLFLMNGSVSVAEESDLRQRHLLGSESS